MPAMRPTVRGHDRRHPFREASLERIQRAERNDQCQRIKKGACELYKLRIRAGRSTRETGHTVRTCLAVGRTSTTISPRFQYRARNRTAARNKPLDAAS